jgi:hypothetical protein
MMQHLDDASRRDVPRATIAGVGVGVAIDFLERPLGILERQILILLPVALLDELLFVLPLPR